MIKNCNDQNLKIKNIGEKYFLLFQVWKELTETKTYDSYQYRIMNTLSGINELALVINQRLNLFANTNHNIDECKLELRKIISNDITLKKHYPGIWMRLVAHLSEKTDSPSQQRALKYQLDYCYNEIIGSYFEYMVVDLEEAINNSDNVAIVTVAGQLISCCVTKGWSTQSLNRIINDLYESAIDSSKWEMFKQNILNNQNHNYEIYIPIGISPKITTNISKTALRENFHNELRGLGINVISPADMTKKLEEYEITNNHLETKYYMNLNIDALDYYSASHMAIRKCSDAMSMLSFFNVIEAWNINGITWLVRNNDTSRYQWVKYGDLYGTYDYLEGARKLIRASKQLVAFESSVQKKLRAAFSYSNMGKASSAQEEKFINTWVALESLCRGDVYENIISNVLETVPPALCTRYIYQLFRNFIEDVTRCEVEFSFSVGRLWSSSTANEEKVKVIISIFEDETLYAELVEKCQINKLLLFRCEELHLLVEDKTKMLAKIEQHNRNVHQQLSRLYRIRNEIAHDALGAEGTLLLYIEHLDDYLAGVVAEIVMCAEKKQIYEIEPIFEVIKDNYRLFLDIKNAKKSTNTNSLLEPLYKTGVLSLV